MSRLEKGEEVMYTPIKDMPPVPAIVEASTKDRVQISYLNRGRSISVWVTMDQLLLQYPNTPDDDEDEGEPDDDQSWR